MKKLVGKIYDIIARVLWGFRKHVVLDPRDSTCTLSKKLWKSMMDLDVNLKRCYVFKFDKYYAFCIDPEQWKDCEDECFSPLQVDGKTGHVGFYLDKPSAIRILRDYDLPMAYPQRVAVTRSDTLVRGEICWILERR